jgi:predicted nucleic acid-binding protein
MKIRVEKIVKLLKRFKINRNKKIKIALDTCVLIDYFDGTGEVAYIQRIFNLLDKEVIEGFVSVVTITEIIKHLRDLEKFGAISNNSIEDILESIEDNFVILSVEYDIANDAGELKSKYSTKLRPLSYNDAFIASTAKSLNLTLITCDGEFFKERVHKLHSRIDEIEILTPESFAVKISKMSKE